MNRRPVVSFRPRHRRRACGGSAGFTLVELMVALVIIALMSATVLLTMADPRGGLGGEVNRFAGKVRLARDSAITGAQPMALWISATGYGFERRRGGRWEPLTDGPLAAANWPAGTTARAATPGRARLLFDTLGRADQPLAFMLERSGSRLAIRIDLDGRVSRGE